jgi:single-strand DNA-binding protein
MSYLPGGVAVTKISIAVSDDYKDKISGQKVAKTNWVPVVLFNRLAEVAGEYLKSGSKVFISGKFQTRSWDKSDGSKGYTTEIVATEMQMLDSRADAGSGAAQQPIAKPAESQVKAVAPHDFFDDGGDSIPF